MSRVTNIFGPPTYKARTIPVPLDDTFTVLARIALDEVFAVEVVPFDKIPYTFVEPVPVCLTLITVVLSLDTILAPCKKSTPTNDMSFVELVNNKVTSSNLQFVFTFTNVVSDETSNNCIVTVCVFAPRIAIPSGIVMDSL